MDRAIHALRTLFSEVLSNCGREAQEVQRPMAAPDRDAPPRLRAWWLQRVSQFSRSVITRCASLGLVAVRAAEARADRLLEANLSQTQREEFEERGYFMVTGGETGKCYRIRRGHQMNVEELDKNGKRRHVLCFMPEGHLAQGDVMLAQKIALELFEFEALKIANRMPPHCSRFPERQEA
jgi:hypothetical protein